MSLQVWLPLNGDLKNYGVSNVTTTVASGVTYTDGKIGQCANAASSVSITATVPNLSTMLANGKTYSLACWVKIKSVGTNDWAIKLGTNTCGLWWGYSSARWVWNENDNGKRCANTTISADTEWHHLVTTVDKTVTNQITTKHYVDGVPAADYPSDTWDSTGQTQPAGDTITITPYVAMLNDIRLYDEILSPKQVKELSKALVVHFPLSQYGVANYFKNSNFATGTVTPWGGVNSSSVSYAEKDGYKCLTGTKGTSNNICCQIIEASSYSYVANTNVTFTISADIYVEDTGTISIGNWITTTEASGWQGMSFTEVWNTSNILKIGWNHVSVTHVNAHKQYNGSIITAFAYTGTTFWLTNAKFEFSEKESKWIPHTGDIIYNTLGFNSTTEYDTSGYKNNGTRVGILESSSDTPRYSVCTGPFGSGKGIYCTPHPCQRTDGEVMTVSCWFKQTSRSDYQYIVCNRDDSGYNWMLYTHTTDGSIQLHGDAQYKSSIIPSLNEWHHVAAVVYSNQTYSLFLDGTKVVNATTYKYHASISNYLNVGKYGNTTTCSGPFNGYISDVRIYATALSDADIKELYQTSASFDNLGNIHAYEIVEDL